MKSKLLPTIIASLSLTAIPVAFGATYQSELAATYSEVDLEDSSSDLSDTTLEGTYYFSQVDTANRPLAESAFLQKASSVYLNGVYSRYKENDSGYSSVDKAYIYGRQIGTEIYIPNSIFYFGAGVTEDKVKTEWINENDINHSSTDWDSRWYVKAGITPVDGLLIWSQFDEDVDISESWNINAKYVMPIGGVGQWLNVEANFADTQGGYGQSQALAFAADYYLDRHLSFGAGISHFTWETDDYDSNENEYFVRANQYFTDNFAVNLKYADGDYESSWTVGATLRF